jgi:hypothetical protein
VTAGAGHGSGEVVLHWSAVTDADGYRILRSPTASGTFGVTCTLNVVTGATSASSGVVNVSSVHHSYVPASTMSGRDSSASFEYVEVRGADKRCFTVVAFNTAGDSASSTVVCGSPPA